MTVTVDRPIGSYHPVHKNLYYPINYGYVKGIMAQDDMRADIFSRCISGCGGPVQPPPGSFLDY